MNAFIIPQGLGTCTSAGEGNKVRTRCWKSSFGLIFLATSRMLSVVLLVTFSSFLVALVPLAKMDSSILHTKPQTLQKATCKCDGMNRN